MKTSSSSYHRWDWLNALLLIALVYTVAARLSLTDWTQDLGTVEVVSLLGTALGLALGISNFGRRAMRWLIAGYTFFIVGSQLARLIVSEETAIGRIASLLGRIGASTLALFSGQKVEDWLFFVVLMSLLFWGIGIYTGYRLMRNPAILPVILPSAIPLLIIQYYDGYIIQRIWAVALYFFLALILIGRMNLLKDRERWQEKRVFAGSEPEFDIVKGLATLTAVIILAAWVSPTPAAAFPAAVRAWKSLNEPFEDTRQRLNDALAALSGSGATTAGELYGNIMGLGQTAGQGVAELFTVKASKSFLVRQYWRVRVYDTYLDSRWVTSTSENLPFDPANGAFVDPTVDPEQTVEFTFNWRSSRSGLLVTPGNPVWTSRTGAYQVSQISLGAQDMLSWSVAPAIEPGDQYRARSVIQNPTIKDLRNAGEEYPDWVRERYLQLPPNLSGDVRRLARDLVADKTNNYDRAMAITDYLRDNIEYSLTIPKAPPGVDPVDWFLFSWKSGFCNYYATAEVLMLRASGIPARMVVGYAQGTRKSDGSYAISGKDAHAWPEVYFPGIGWVEFEPTVSQNPLLRPSGEVSPLEADDAFPSIQERLSRAIGSEEDLTLPGENDPRPNLPAATTLSRIQLTWLWVIISIMAVAGAGVGLWRLERKETFARRVPRALRTFYIRNRLTTPAWVDTWVRWSEVTAIERAFHVINQSLRWMGNPQPEYSTPVERTQLLKRLVPAAAEHIDLLSAAHEQTLYTPRPADPAKAIRAGWTIRYLTLRAILHRWLYGE